jgi:exonuclease III
MGWSTRIYEHIKQVKKDVIALTECGRKIQAFAGPELLVGEPPPAGDPAGVAAIHLSPRAQRMVMNSGHKGSRLVWVRLEGLFANLFIISAYVPHAYRKQAPFREDTLAELQDLIREKSVKGDCLVVMGDMNSKLARNSKGLTGRFCMHAQADAGGERLSEIMQAENLSAASTFFCPRKGASLGQATYIPKVKTHRPSQIDYVLVSRKWLSSVRSCRVEWSHSISRHLRRFDHGMVSIVLNLRIASQKSRPTRLNRAWLCDKKNAPAFDAAYCRARKEQGLEQSTLSQEFKGITSFFRSAIKVVPPASKIKSGGMRSERTRRLVAARASCLQGEKEGTQEYKARLALFKKEIAASCREDYREKMDGILADMEACDDRGDSKGVQAGVHLISGKKKRFCTKQPVVDETGKQISLPEELAAAWGRFCEKKFAATEAEENREPPETLQRFSLMSTHASEMIKNQSCSFFI